LRLHVAAAGQVAGERVLVRQPLAALPAAEQQVLAQQVPHERRLGGPVPARSAHSTTL
jgi:hypothetical protein